MKTFKQYLNEMPLPLNMPDDSLVPKQGKYTKAGPEKALGTVGTKVGKGSSRVAYRVHVEKEQFGPEENYAGLPETPQGKIDTVIKLALNAKGVAQNEQEISTYNDYDHYDFLLPIIDSSKLHKVNVIIKNGGSYEDKKQADESYSNWVQMPYVEVLKSPEKFDQYFVKYFGDLKNAIKSVGINPFARYSFECLYRGNFEKAFSKLSEGEYINEDQMERLNGLMEMYYNGFSLNDLQPRNWGIYKNRPVILDYGFDSSTVGLYSGAQKAEAFVDYKGNIELKIRDVPPRRGW